MTLSGLIETWLTRSAKLRELEALGRDGRDALARDLRVPVAALDQIARRDPTAGAGLEPLMLQLSLDPAKVAGEHAATVRDLQEVCSGCDVARRCGRALQTGDAALTFGEFCPNAQTLQALRAEMSPGLPAA